MTTHTARTVTGLVATWVFIAASHPGWGAWDTAMSAAGESVQSWVHHPPGWFQALLAVVVLSWVMSAIASAAPDLKDTQRLFTPTQRREVFVRAGHRCEHKDPLWFRCSASATHADHIQPHSRGGPTAVSNAQALCARHNLRKSASVPSPLYVWRLQRRRRAYFPTGASPKVDRRKIAV